MVDLTTGNKAARVIYCLATQELPTSHSIADATGMSVQGIKNIIAEIRLPFPNGLGMDIHWDNVGAAKMRKYKIKDWGIVDKKALGYK